MQSPTTVFAIAFFSSLDCPGGSEVQVWKEKEKIQHFRWCQLINRRDGSCCWKAQGIKGVKQGGYMSERYCTEQFVWGFGRKGSKWLRRWTETRKERCQHRPKIKYNWNISWEVSVWHLNYIVLRHGWTLESKPQTEKTQPQNVKSNESMDQFVTEFQT